MGRMNIYLDEGEDAKLNRLKDKFNITSKEEVIKRLIKQFPEEPKELDLAGPELDTEIDMGDLI